MLSICEFLHMCVCVFVCLFVCLYVCVLIFEAPFKRLFAPIFRSRMSNILRDLESLGGKYWKKVVSQFKPFIKKGCKMAAQKKSANLGLINH